MQLSDQLMRSMAMGKVFKESDETINSLDHFSNGKYLVTASDDKCVRLYDCVSGQRKTQLNSLKYGVDLVRFTHHDRAVICASNNGNDETLRYWSLHDNSYLRYFRGHRAKVESISMSPVNDTFLSGSADNTCRLWDLRTNVCQGIIHRKGRPAVSFDPSGAVFAVTAANNEIKLFDTREFDKGPFANFKVSYEQPFEWTSIKFSPCGDYLLCSTTCDAIFLLDAFNGELKKILTQRKNPARMKLEASFTPDSQYILAGGEDGTVHIWNIAGTAITVLRGHTGPVRNVQWNPTFGTFASSCENLALWLPTK